MDDKRLRPGLASLLFGVALLLCMAIGVAIRMEIVREVGRANARALGSSALEEVPFSRESAIQFRQLRQYYNTGSLPERDPRIQWPDGVNIAETYTIGSERVYAPLMRNMPADWSIVRRARTASVLWFCLAIPLLGIAARRLFDSRLAGGITAFLYAVSAAAVVRSSGLELSSENFALPFVCAFLAFEAWAPTAATRRGHWLLAGLAALSLAFAMAAWDMVQVMVMLWTGVAYVRLLRPRDERSRDFFLRFTLVVVVLFAAGCLNPYLRAHAFPRSPLLCFAAAVAVLGLLANRGNTATPPRRLWRALLPWLIFIAAFLVARGIGDSYGHFGELLTAKLRFLNRKPFDPELLTFNQRILWTPALHSMTWALLKDYFPALFLLTPVTLAVYLFSRSSGDSRAPVFPAAFCLLCFAACVLFFRFHVYVILFASMVAGGALAVSVRKGLAQVWIPLSVALAAGIAVEAVNSVRRAGTRWAAESPLAAKVADELLDWLKANAPDAPVAANFTISGPIVSQAGNPVVMHPKYEDRVIRDRVEAYATLLFRGDERAFRDWCESVDARLVVFALGEFSPDSVELTPAGIRLKPGPRTPQVREFLTGQMRYMAAALTPVDTSPAVLFLKRAVEESTARTHRGFRRTLRMDEPRFFRLEWTNEKYAVYRVITTKDQEMADGFVEMAGLALSSGDAVTARKRVSSAFEYDPHHPGAYALLAKIERFRALQGTPGRE